MFLVSPGVEVKEIDATNVIPAISTTIGGIVGQFGWGPCEEIVTISSEKDLVQTFGKPTDQFISPYFFSAASFLKYSNTLKTVRVVGAAAKNADSAGADEQILIKNASHFETLTPTALFTAKYPGAMGNSIKVVALLGAYAAGAIDYSVHFDNLDLDDGIVHLLVIDVYGLHTGTAGTILEKYSYLDTNDPLAKSTDGGSAYFKTVINTQSSYIWTTATELVDITNHSSFEDGATDVTLDGGVTDTSAVSTVDVYGTYFGDAETVDVNYLIGAECSVSKANNLIAVADARKDCIAVISAATSLTANIASATATSNLKTFADQLTSSSYWTGGTGAVYMYDKYNDVYKWVPESGHIAGLCANTAAVAEPWFSPAGYNRGNLRGVVKLAFNPNQTQRDTLYKARLNPIVSFPGQGVLLYGDKTGLAKPSAFDRINVRQLFIVLEKAIATASKYQLFELNDEFTRAMFRNMVEPFLRDVKGRRGITDFYVVCDETNNTGEVIDSNRFVASIFIKPARSINFITLNFIATRTGVEFSELIGTASA